MRKGKVCLVHRTAKLSIQSPSIGKLNDDGRLKGSGHQDSILFQETRWSVTGGEEKVERSERENSEVEQMGGGAPFPELCQLCGLEEIVEANTCVARCEQLSVHCSRVLVDVNYFIKKTLTSLSINVAIEVEFCKWLKGHLVPCVGHHRTSLKEEHQMESSFLPEEYPGRFYC